MYDLHHQATEKLFLESLLYNVKQTTLKPDKKYCLIQKKTRVKRNVFMN